MGNQCCQGNNSLDDKNSITMVNAKEGLAKQESVKTLSLEKEPKFKDEDSRQFKYGKSIKSHNSKQDYMEGEDRLIGSQSNNQAFDDQIQSQKGSHAEKIGLQKYSSKDIYEKSVARASSGVGVYPKESLLKAIAQNEAYDNLSKDSPRNKPPQSQNSLHSKDVGAISAAAGSATSISNNYQQQSGNRPSTGSAAAIATSAAAAAAANGSGSNFGNPSNAQPNASESKAKKTSVSTSSNGSAEKATVSSTAGQANSAQQIRNSSNQPANSGQNGMKNPQSAGIPPSSAKSSKKSDVPNTASTASSSPISGPGELTQKRVSTENINEKAQKKQAMEKSSKTEEEGQKKDQNFFSASSLIHPKKGSFSQFYKVGEILGEGAFGQVSKVIHKNTGIIRAMKTIKKSGIIKEEEDRLFSEMVILKNLDHPNILRLFELFQDSKNYYLITEYCSGGELFDKIKTMTNFTEKIAADYMKQILSAVVYCHSQNIVHRDLKPENLLFDSEKKNANIKVIDFGTSRKIEKNQKMSKRLGTPYYIAPEVLDQNYDEKCDVWSCGVILYILLCGYPPFGGRSEDEILKKVRAGKFRFEAEDWERISDDAKNLINRMLTYDPRKRPTAEAALADSWIQKNAPSNHISTRALNNLSSFQTRSKLKQAILTFIVSQVVSQNDKEELQKTFRQLDKNGDGTLSKEELIEGYTTVLGDRTKAIEQVDRIFKEVDLNRSGVVDFTEFLMAAANKEILLSKAKVEQSFKIFDQDGNGNITQEELSNIMGDISDDFWKEILDECDTNKDGMISQTEFIDLLLKKKVHL